MNRYILWSLAFHLAVVLGGAGLAPMSGLVTTGPSADLVISVGLVDAPNAGPSGGPAQQEPVAVPAPKLEVPPPAMDAELALRPMADLTKENVEPPKKEPPKPPDAEKKQPEKKDPPKAETKKPAKPAAEKTGQQFASSDTVGGSRGAITDGTGAGGDVWGVETGPSVSPYHRRGFASIRSNWRNPAVGNRPLKCTIRFVVKRNGEVTNAKIESRSGNELFDRAALRAVEMTTNWEQFPTFWPEDEQIILLDFEYRP